MNDNFEDVVVINLRSLFFYVLSKWRWILACFLVGALTGGIVSYVQMQQNNPENLKKKVEQIDVDDNDFNMEHIRQVAAYQTLYEAQVARDEDSYLLKMDPANVYSSVITYYIRTNELNIDIIDTYLDNILNRDDQLSKLWEASGMFCSETAFTSLISVSFTPSEVPEQINVENAGKQNRGGVLTIRITAPDTDSRAVIKERLTTLTVDSLEHLSARYPDDYYYENISDIDSLGFSTAVSNSIKVNTDTRKELLENLNSLKKNLTKDENAYYLYHYSNEVENTVFSKKPPLLGGIIGALLSTMIFAVVYLLDRHVKDENESLLSKIRHLCVLEAKSAPQKGIDRWIYDCSNIGKGVLKETGYLNSILSTVECNDAVLLGDTEDPDIVELINQLRSFDKRLHPISNITSDALAINNIKETDGVILVVHLMKDYRDVIKKELEVLKATDTNVFGTVFVR